MKEEEKKKKDFTLRFAVERQMIFLLRARDKEDKREIEIRAAEINFRGKGEKEINKIKRQVVSFSFFSLSLV